MLDEVTRLAGSAPAATAVDGCGVVTLALSLRQMAIAYAGIEGPVPDAMRAHPELIRGPKGLDTNLMQSLDGWFAKGGAEGLLCAASADGLGLALKVEDGSQRALRPAVGRFLDQLGHDGSAFGPVPIRNSRDELVGELRAC
jgi:L-asparaginase II